MTNLITERGRALIIAAAVLDRPNADPDDDIAILARQLSRAEEEADALKGKTQWAVNILLEKIAEKFEGWETYDIWRSDAAMVVRGFKHPGDALTTSDREPTK